MTKKKIDSMVSLRENLCDMLLDVREKRLDRHEAKEMTNIAGKIIASVTVELKAAALNKEPHNIAFLKAA
jgi:hypothetical protein